MPFNKFGNFLYHTTKPHRLSAHQYLSIPQEKEDESKRRVETYKSICVVSLKGTRRSDSVFYYFFENTLKNYIFPFDGIIKDIVTSTENILFILNDALSISKNELVGKTFKRDDKLGVIRSIEHPPENNIVIQFVFLCPLIQ